MTKITEDKLEQICLDWFRVGGYDYAFGPDIAHDGDTPERSDYQQVVLIGRLLAALQKINPHIPIESLEEAAQAVTKPESPVLIHNNRAFHKLLLEGIFVRCRNATWPWNCWKNCCVTRSRPAPRIMWCWK